MTENAFTKGVYVKKEYDSFGKEVISVSIKLDEFEKNEQTQKGYINFDIKTSKNGKYYPKTKVYVDYVSKYRLPTIYGEGKLNRDH